MCMYIFFYIYTHLYENKAPSLVAWASEEQWNSTSGPSPFLGCIARQRRLPNPSRGAATKRFGKATRTPLWFTFFYFKDILGMQQSWIIWFNLLPISVFWHTSNVVFDVVSDVVNLGFVLSHKICCCKFGGFFLT